MVRHAVAIVVVVPPISKIKGEGKYREDCLHRRPGGVAGYSKETLKKFTKSHFGMTEVHAVCKLAMPWSPSHGQCECYLCQLRYFVLLYSLAVWCKVPNFVDCWAISDQKGMSYLAKKKNKASLHRS
jgi:hypothetical protein